MNLENLNLVELNAQEVQEVEGGILGYVLTFLGGVAWSAWENVGDIRAGWEDGKTGATRY